MLSFLVFTAATTVQAQMMPIGLNGKIMLLAFNEVKKEIHLSKDQDKQIQKIGEDMQKDSSQLKIPDMHYMTRPMDDKLVGILDQAQNTRINELFWQFNGLFALTENDLCDALALSDDVRASCKILIKAYDKEVTDELMSRKGKMDKKKNAELREKTLAGLAALLTPEQSEKWIALQGKPFKFPKMGR